MTKGTPFDDPDGNWRYVGGSIGWTRADSPTPRFASELTPEGEQTVIPGCERNAAPGKRQLDLF